MLLKLIDKYRKQAQKNYEGRPSHDPTWREAILETIFRPLLKVPGKEPMSHLHPDIKKLHLPHGVYIADWRKYKVEDHPALVNFQKRCHASGLHDPWLRNHAWKFYPNLLYCRSVTRVVTHGCLTGFLIGGTIFLLEKTYDYFYPPEYIHTERYEGPHH